MKFSLPLRRNSTCSCSETSPPLLWIPNPRILDILTIQVIRKNLTDKGMEALACCTFPLGAEFAGFSGFLDSLSQSPWGEPALAFQSTGA